MAVPEYNINDLVTYENRLYRITNVHFMNHQLSDPFVYTLVLISNKPGLNPVSIGDQLYIRGSLLAQTKAISVLYADE